MSLFGIYACIVMVTALFYGYSVEMMKNRLKEINKGLFEFDPVASKTAGGGAGKSGGDEKMDVDEQEVAEEAPTKCISTPLTVDIKARIKFVDYEGRVDAESLQKILAQINPKRLVSLVSACFLHE